SSKEDEQFETDLARVVRRRDLGNHVLISIREDALFELNRLRARIPNVLARSLKLDYLDRDSAEEAITGPLAVWGSENGEYNGPTRAAPELIDALIQQVSRPGDATRIETPYLQLALKRLWQVERQRGSGELRRETLNELRGAGGIAESHFKDTMKALPTDERRLCAAVLDRMVTPSGMKIALTAHDLAAMTSEDGEQVAAVLAKLAAGRSRIIHKVSSPMEGGQPLFEIFHDVLARPILDWIAADRERARQEKKLAEQRRLAEEERRRQQAVLEEQQAEAAREQERHQQEVARQKRQIAREKRLKRRYFAFFVAACALAVVASATAGYAVITQRKEAATRGRMLASQSKQEFSIGDGRASLLLSLAALPAKPGVLDEVFWPERDTALGTLKQGLAMPVGTNLPSARGRLTLAAFNADGTAIVTASEKGVAQLWKADQIARLWAGRIDQKPDALTHDKPAEIASAVFDRSGKLLVTADFDGLVNVWHTDAGDRWANWKPHDRPTSAAIIGDGTLIATASFGDGLPHLWAADPWNSEAAPVEKRLAWGERHTTGITALAFDPDGGRLASTSFDGTARVWRTCDGTLLMTVTHGGASIVGAAFSPDGRRLITGGWDGTVRLWALPPPDSARGAVCRPPSMPLSEPLAAAARTSNRRTPGPPVTSKPLLTLPHGARIASVAFDASGRQIVTAALDGAARVWDAESGALLRRLQGPNEVAGRFASASISPDGRTVLATFMQHRAYLWPLHPDAALPKVRNLPARPLAVSASTDGRHVAVATDTSLRVFDSATGETLRTVAFDRPPLSAAMSPGGVFVAAASGSTVGIWSIDGEEPAYRQLPDHGSLVLSVAYDRYGQRIVTTCQDGSVRLWDALARPLLGGRVLFAPPGEGTGERRSPVFAAAFSRDGSRVFAGSFDGRIRVADAATGEEQSEQTIHAGRPVIGLAVSDDPRRLVADLLGGRGDDAAPASDNAFRVRPQIFDTETRRPLIKDEPIDIDHYTELLQAGNVVETSDGNGSRSTVVLPLDRRLRLGPLPPMDPAGLVSYARQTRLATLPETLRSLSDKEQQDRGLASGSANTEGADDPAAPGR
ncbi:MAG TPA: WD40 repeat domain-containing protein, partial [Rhodospirillales bacterium]|nr:WD40 repeat domain-containing protein [Rhodospirillales bacterium]